MSGCKIAVVGECMIELRGQPFSSMQQNFGGDTMNTAIYLKRVAESSTVVSYVTAMGQDPLSEAIIKKWQHAGVDTQFVQLNSDKEAGLYLIQNDPSGERTFHYWRNDAAARYLMQHDAIKQVFEQLADYDVIYLSGISLAILEPEDREVLIGFLRQLKERGVKIVFDGNYRPKLWNSISQTQTLYEVMYGISDLALLTFEDEQLLWNDSSLNGCIERLQDSNIAELVVKDGANGCYYCGNKSTQHVPTTLVDNVVDTTAAGDSFNAGFLAGWLSNKDPLVCADMGNQLAGQVIQQAGAIVETQPLIQGRSND